MDKKFGFLTIAFGKERYVEQGNTLARSLRKHMPNIPIACVTDAKLDPKLFDYVIPLDKSKGNSFIQKLWIDYYTPFESTLFIDSDCIAGAPFHEHLAELKNYDVTPVCDNYLSKTDIDKDGWIADIGKALQLVDGQTYPKFNGGVYYFNNSEKSKVFFEKVRELEKMGDQLGLLSPTGAGYGDEAIFALALESLKMTPLYDDKGGLMRTPIGIKGKIKMNPDFSNFSFIKYSKLVKPAICHFAGSYDSPEYMRASYYLKHGKIPFLVNTKISLMHARKMAENYGHTINKKLFER